MERERLTLQQKQYLVSELKDVVDNYEVYELDSPSDYDTILSILTGMLNEDWHTHFSEVEIDEFLNDYFKTELKS
jgi:hypothetical protein